MHMHFTQAVAIFVASEFASSMVDALMVVSPHPQAGINAVLVRVLNNLQLKAGGLGEHQKPGEAYPSGVE
jgi:hypothetical protein